jgi:hypothetical protein
MPGYILAKARTNGLNVAISKKIPLEIGRLCEKNSEKNPLDKSQPLFWVIVKECNFTTKKQKH